MNWDRVVRSLEQQAGEFQDAANRDAVMKGRAKSAERNDTLAQIARMLAKALRFGMSQ